VLFVGWALVGVVFCAAMMDLRDVLRGRRLRRSDDMLRARRDERADDWSTQHCGISFPIDHVGKDRGTPGRRVVRR
jgi:hypothetical protein